MLISIIIPIYNVEKYLNRCLDSVMKQSFQDIEIILVNDGSTDNSDNIIKSYLFDERIKYIYQYLQPVITQYLVSNKSEIWP